MNKPLKEKYKYELMAVLWKMPLSEYRIQETTKEILEVFKTAINAQELRNKASRKYMAKNYKTKK